MPKAPPSAPTPRPTRRRRPIGLAALRGFEAAARRLSFTLAAEELALTPSSISRQIGALERQVGKALFVRRTRALALTPAGAQLQAAVTQALAGLDRCVEEIRGVGRPPRVSLTTFPSFASMWLVPRLVAFQRLHPQVEFRIDASDRMVDLAAEGMDLAIRRARPDQLGATEGVTPLWVETVTPALSPHLLERHGAPLNAPQDLAALPLIEMDAQWPAARAGSWPRWFDFAGARRRGPAPASLSFSYLDQAIQAAVRGQGVVLGRTPLVDDAVASGQLVLPFPALRMATGYRYSLVLPAERSAAPEVAAFSRWLAEEFQRGPQRYS